MFQVTKKIERAFKEKKLPYEIFDHEEVSILQVPFSGQNIRSAKVSFISMDNSNNVAVRVLNMGVVREERISIVLLLLNELNNRYRYLKFVMDENRVVSIQYDLPESGKGIGAICFEVVQRFIRVVDEAYPELMEAIWG